MFDETNKYEINDHFFFTAKNDLMDVCNAPNDKSGVYLIYALKNGRIELVYIGRSGELKPDGTMLVRKAGLGGLKDRLVNGQQFGDERKKSWKVIMEFEKIDALDIYWYVTHNDKYADCPSKIEHKILMKYKEIYGELPSWNLKD